MLALISDSFCFRISELRILPLGAGLSNVVTEAVCVGGIFVNYSFVVSEF